MKKEKFIKNCLELFTKRVFSEKKCVVEKLGLFWFTMARQINDLSNIVLSLKQKINKCSVFSITLGESKDVSDTAQLVFQYLKLSQDLQVSAEQYFNITCKLIEKFFFTIQGITTTAVLLGTKLSGPKH